MSTSRLKAFWGLRRSRPGEFWHTCLFWSFWFHTLLFISGYAFRDVMPLVSAVFLAMYYRHCWQESVLRRLPALPCFACLLGMFLVGIVFSISPWNSFLEVATTFNKGLLLAVIGMECVRDLQDLRRLVQACCLALVWSGLDGVYQAVHGVDFIMGYPLSHGRLTSVMDDYEIGNYLGQALVPACGVWYLMRDRWSAPAATAVILVLLAPALYTLQGTGVRSAVLGLTASCLVWIWARRAPAWRRHILMLLALVAAFAVFNQICDAYRLNIDTVAADGRWSLWYLGWSVFVEHPVFGAGIDMYNTAFRALGLVPVKDAITISHPHNMYLDILCSTGIVGAAMGYTFLFGMLAWQARRLLPRLRRDWTPPAGADPAAPGCSAVYWILAGLFGLDWVTWMVEGIFGHELLRVWWFAHAMAALGVTIGAVVRGMEAEERARRRAS